MFDPQNVPFIQMVVAGFILVAGLLISLRLLFWSLSKNKHNYNYRQNHHSENQQPMWERSNDLTNPTSPLNIVNPLTPSANAINTNGMESTTSEPLDPPNLAQMGVNGGIETDLTSDCHYQQSFINAHSPANGLTPNSNDISNSTTNPWENLVPDLALANDQLDTVDPSNQLFSMHEPAAMQLDLETNNLYFDESKYQDYLNTKSHNDNL